MLIESNFLFPMNRNNYKGYSLESRLHFRIHAALSQLKTATEDSGAEVENGEMVMDGFPDEFQDPTLVEEAKRTTKL